MTTTYMETGVDQGEVAMQTRMCVRGGNLMSAPSGEILDVIYLCDQSGGAGHKLPPNSQVVFVDLLSFKIIVLEGESRHQSTARTQ